MIAMKAITEAGNRTTGIVLSAVSIENSVSMWVNNNATIIGLSFSLITMIATVYFLREGNQLKKRALDIRERELNLSVQQKATQASSDDTQEV